MTASEQMNNVVMGCVYGEALYKFLQIENQLPTKKTPFKQGVNEELRTWNRYYADLLMGIVGRVGTNIDAVRQKYSKDKEIPVYEKKVSAR